MGDFFIFGLPVSLGTILYQLVIFSILVFVLHKLFIKKVIEMLDSRRDRIVEQIASTEKFKQEAREKLIEQEELLEDAKIAASNIRKKAEAEAEFIIRKAKAEAKKYYAQVSEDMSKKKGA